jgi:sensor histidine kinase YesM
MISKIEKVVLFLLFIMIYYALIYHPTEPIFMGEFNNKDGSIYAARFVDVLVSLIIFFTVSFMLVPRYLARRKIWPFAIGSAILLIGVTSIEYGLDRLLLQLYHLPTGPNEISDKMMQYARRTVYPNPILLGNLLIYVLGLLYGLSRDWVIKTRRQSQLVREKMQADIDFLRSQINPHFFFNALNNIYAITKRNMDEEAGDALMKLSDVMRYMIYDSDVRFIGLDKEIEYIRMYLDVMRLKFSKDDRLDIQISQKGKLANYQIAPLILLPFVENAFKHGFSTLGEGYIHINIQAVDDCFQVRIENSKQPVQRTLRKHPGIGLENVKKRLSLIYPDKHTLQFHDDEENYCVELTIDLKE